MQDLEHAGAVRRMQQYISEHLEEDLSLHTLAREAGYSPWHSARMFREYTGTAPFEYIRRLRLTKAALVLRDEKRKVIDVAMDFVFDSHEGFTRAFRREFGMTPKSYQQSTPPIALFTPYYADAQLLMGTDRTGLPPLSGRFRTEIVEFPKRRMILRCAKNASGYFEYVEEVGCDVWGVLVSVREALYEPVGAWLPDALRPEGTGVYAQGVEVPASYQGPVPEGFSVLDLDACTMMMFQGEPFDEDRFDEAVLGLSEIISGYDPAQDGYAWADDDAPRIQLEPQGYRGYLEARPVRHVLC